MLDKEVIKKLTIEEKLSLLEGFGAWYTKKIDRLNIPSIMMTDGPHGIRKEIQSIDNLGLMGSEVATLFPTESTLGCSFNKELAYKYGKAIGIQARSKDVAIVLGPGLNIKRHPACGRNFEYYSEDPYLTGVMGQNVIKGIQSNNVGACCKHYACNSQEKYRFSIDSIVDDRALREIYTKAFKMACDVNVAAIMGSYNKVNNVFACDSSYLMKDLLRTEYGFNGVIMTDWGACNNKTSQIKAGVDLEMPSSNGYNNKNVFASYQAGKISNEEIDDCVERILNVVDQYKDNKTINADLDDAHILAKEIASEGIVLLKNENEILPLKQDDRIGFIGDLFKNPRLQGGGSSFINPYKVENAVDNFEKYAVNYSYAQGYNINSFENDDNLMKEAIEVAKNCHKVIYYMGLNQRSECEGYDRTTLDLPKNQLELLEELWKVNRNIVVVVSAGGVVNLSFNDKVRALLHANVGGEAGAIAIMDVLFGIVNPSARLSETYAESREDYITDRNFSNANNAIYYSESIFVGYRYFNTFNKKVIYPFGYGLSYTQFEYSDFKVVQKNITKNKKIKVSVKVKNIGKFSGKEVVLLFVENNENSSVYKAKKELRRFEKVSLNPDESKMVSFELDYDDFSYYDVLLKKNNVDMGRYKVQICKNVEEVIFEESVERKENEIGFKKHEHSSYNRKDRLVIKDDDFQKIMNIPLPNRNENKKRPYTLSSTLEDISNTFAGRMVLKKINSMVSDLDINDGNDWLEENLKNNLNFISIKNLVAFGGDYLSFEAGEGIIDLANGKYIRGLKKVLRGMKK